jgi:hypothetical protein
VRHKLCNTCFFAHIPLNIGRCDLHLVAFDSPYNFAYKYLKTLFTVWVFELCRRTQQPSLTFCLVGGSMFGLWPLFHLRDGGKGTEMTATQHGGTLRHIFLHYITIKIMLVFFHFLVFSKNNWCYFYLSDLVSPSTGCKSQLFKR